MNHSRIKASVAALAVAALIGLSACGGGSDGLSQAEEEALQAELAAAEEAKRQAELEQARAEARAEEARRQRQAAEAERQREEQARQAAEQQRQAEEEARRAAEQARQEAEERRQAAEERLSQSDEERQFAGFGTSAGTLSVTPRNADPAIIRTPSIGAGAAGTAVGSWAVTTGSDNDGTYSDSVTIYSDVGAPTSVPFQDSDYNAGRRVINAEGEVVGAYSIRGARTDVSATGGAGNFPNVSGRPQTFELVDRGRTQAEIDRLPADQQSGLTPRDVDTYPQRYSVDVTAETLGGAAGRFRCEASSANTACTVQNRGGGQLFFAGPWSFRPNDGATVSVADEHFMWFGSWARENTATREWSYAVGHGPAGSRVRSVSAVSGTATYTGSAIGRFAIDRELGTDEAGAFTATASLNADFDANSLSGNLNTFLDGDGTAIPGSWIVHLRNSSIIGGSASGTSAWTIGGNADEGGSWAASFYSDLPANQRTGVVPHGIAGTFTAEHSGIAKMIGAFGAHKQ